MPLHEGQTLPDATVLVMGETGPEEVSLKETLAGRKVVLFGLPGAYTGTCTTAHVPSFIRTSQAFADRGIDEILCLAVNDPFVLRAWGEATGATAAGITMIADVEAAFTKAVGMEFSVPSRGFIDRSKRYAMIVDDGVVTALNVEPQGGECDISGGEALLERLD